MFVYCSKCGHIQKMNRQQNCSVCDNELQQVPEKYLSANKNLFQSQEARELFIEEVIVTNSSYNNEIAKNRNIILNEKEQQHRKEVEEKVRKYKESKPTCKCPVCGSTNLSAISNVGKFVKISLIGVWGAGDLGKQRRCNSCGHKF